MAVLPVQAALLAANAAAADLPQRDAAAVNDPVRPEDIVVTRRVPARGLLNLRIGLRQPDRRWDVALRLRNALDKHYFLALNPAATGMATGIPGDPGTIGVTLRTALRGALREPLTKSFAATQH